MSGGKNTQDKVFLLSLEDVWKYSGCFKFSSIVDIGMDSWKLVPTKYALSRGAYQYVGSESDCKLNGVGCGIWWLRSPGFVRNQASIINEAGLTNAIDVRDDGILAVNDGTKCYGHTCVRPALWVNLDLLTP